jgi:hypothetical protein
MIKIILDEEALKNYEEREGMIDQTLKLKEGDKIYAQLEITNPRIANFLLMKLLYAFKAIDGYENLGFKFNEYRKEEPMHHIKLKKVLEDALNELNEVEST